MQTSTLHTGCSYVSISFMNAEEYHTKFLFSAFLAEPSTVCDVALYHLIAALGMNNWSWVQYHISNYQLKTRVPWGSMIQLCQYAWECQWGFHGYPSLSPQDRSLVVGIKPQLASLFLMLGPLWNSFPGSASACKSQLLHCPSRPISKVLSNHTSTGGCLLQCLASSLLDAHSKFWCHLFPWSLNFFRMSTLRSHHTLEISTQLGRRRWPKWNASIEVSL